MIFALEIIGILTFTVDYLQNRVFYDGEIIRNEAGEGSRKEVLEVARGKEKDSLEIEINNRKLSKMEKEKYIKEAEKEIDRTFPGKNKSIDKIKKPVVMRSEYRDGKVSATWNFSRDDLVTSKGVITNESIEDREMVDAIVNLACDDMEETYNFSFVVMKPDINEQEDFVKLVQNLVKNKDRSVPEKERFVLPDTIYGKKINWKKPMEKRGEIICALGLLLIIIWPLREKEILKTKKKKRNEDLERDYPEIIRKLSLFVSCGMTVKKSFEIITRDYSESILEIKTECRAGYDSVLKITRLIQSGTSEMEAYERMGRDDRVFRKLSTILTQNLRLGTEDMQAKLEREAIDAETRERQRIRMAGEKISTRLLIPLMGILGIVMVVLMVPAMWGISI
ncbi:MAG: type II secretion system F family protein [Lachnospiraceae bacterium]|nr:type II secretion system F family protein [Lachnospiraceae bacterium]